MNDYESQVSRDTLVRLIGEDAALRLLWEENHCLQALLADTEARVKDTEEQLNSTERLLIKRNGEMDSLIAAIDSERADYARILGNKEATIANRNEMISDLRQEVADLRDNLDQYELIVQNRDNEIKTLEHRHDVFVSTMSPNADTVNAALVGLLNGGMSEVMDTATTGCRASTAQRLRKAVPGMTAQVSHNIAAQIILFMQVKE